MRGWLVLVYGVLCYAAFLGTLVYAIGFVGGFVVPTTLDGPATGPLAEAIAIDAALLALFAVQHSGMARQGFKRWLTRRIPVEAERSTYVLASSAVLCLLFWQWRPLGGTVWTSEGIVHDALVGAYLAGWVLLVYVTFLIDHFDLFGLRQSWNAWKGREYRPPVFRTPSLYRWVRHPLYVGWLLIFWAAPTMTIGHLVFAAGSTAYILVAIRFEERDLLAIHGQEYADYQQRVPMLVPMPQRRAGDPTGSVGAG